MTDRFVSCMYLFPEIAAVQTGARAFVEMTPPPPSSPAKKFSIESIAHFPQGTSVVWREVPADLLPGGIFEIDHAARTGETGPTAAASGGSSEPAAPPVEHISKVIAEPCVWCTTTVPLGSITTKNPEAPEFLLAGDESTTWIGLELEAEGGKAKLIVACSEHCVKSFLNH